jgi:O-methyltransferase
MTPDQVTQRVLAEVAPFTMVHPASLELTIALALDAVDRQLPGPLVECGTWMGGASFAMLLAQRYTFGRIVKPVWMFDSFMGLPPAQEQDGPAAAAWQHDVTSPSYFDNCTAPLDQVRAAIGSFGFASDEAVLVPGWFDDTVPARQEELRRQGIAFLRVDCDWYAPVRLVLEQFAQLVADEGKIILDDYFAWDGCARATHDFLSNNNLAWRLRTIGAGPDVGAWMIKRPFRDPGR